MCDTDDERRTRDERSGPAIDRLIESNLGFVYKVAGPYRNMGVPFEDLVNEGNLGLIKAAHRYDPACNTKFITYAVWWIRKAILQALSEHSRLVRVPSYCQKKAREVREVERSLQFKLGRAPGLEEVSERMSEPVGTLERTLQMTRAGLCLDESTDEDRRRPVSDRLVDLSAPSAEDDLIRRETESLVGEAMNHLSRQEQQVLNWRFGLNGQRPLKLREVGEKIGVSRERVRQIEVQAKERLRRVFARRRVVRSPLKSGPPGRCAIGPFPEVR